MQTRSMGNIGKTKLLAVDRDRIADELGRRMMKNNLKHWTSCMLTVTTPQQIVTDFLKPPLVNFNA